ncbi:MAG TPA: Crp/Fnr family transcriptional regulator [Kineosporiaceae bacterium]|nr:Crp/Fnr family transcriptional regulator [Kineosporiaceae bacterium]
MPWEAPPTSRVLAALPLFSQVPELLLEVVGEAAQRVRLRRGQVLFRRGDPCTGFFVVLRGQMKLALGSADGNEKVLEIIGPGESFAEAAMFAGRPFPVTASALEAGDLLAVPSRAVDALLDADPAFARRMLAGLSARLHTMVADVGAMALHSGTQRVIGFLLGELGPAADPAPEGGGGRVRLPVGKAVLASRLSLTPETFSRVLRLLSEQGLLSVRGREVVVHDPGALAGYSGG